MGKLMVALHEKHEALIGQSNNSTYTSIGECTT